MAARLAAAGRRRFAMIDGPADSAMAQYRRRDIAKRLACPERRVFSPSVIEGVTARLDPA